MSTLQTTNLKNASSGSNNIVLATDGSTTITTLNSTTITGTSVRGVITSGTAVASTSGTSIDFTGIPSWVKRVTVMFSGVSTNGTSINLIQIGDSGGIENTGYSGVGTSITSTPGVIVAAQTAGFGIGGNNSAANTKNGDAVLTMLTGNTWTINGQFAFGNEARTDFTAGSKTLSGTLDRVRITTVNGTDTFDAGSINILYEG
jgi:hypothetical protein